MSDERYRGRSDPYFAPERDYAPDSQHEGNSQHEGDNHPSDGQTELRDGYDQHDSHNRYSEYREDASQRNSGYHTPGNNNHRTQQHRERLPPARDHGYDRNGRRDDYRERYPHDNPERDIRKRGVIYPVQFHGKTSEYFKIWIVNVFLTIVTLYIYSAWAKVRTKRYFYGNTIIDKSSFEYHATGRHLVIGRLIAAALLITYTFFQGINPSIAAVSLGILMMMFPWAVWRSLRFNAKASSYRNIRFGFEGQAAKPYVNIVIIPAIVLGFLGLVIYVLSNITGTTSIEDLTNQSPTDIYTLAGGTLITLVLTVALIAPILHTNLISYSLNNHRYGSARFSAYISTGRVYGIHLITIILSLFALAVVGAVLYGLFKLLLQSQLLLDNSEFLTRLEPYANILSGLLFYLIAIPITGVAVAFFRSRIRNLRYNATTIGSRVQLESTTTTWSLWWLNLSNLALLILSLGLAYPFTKIRSARYFARHTSVIVEGGLDSFMEREKTKLNAMGEEMADAFDIEFDIGI